MLKSKFWQAFFALSPLVCLLLLLIGYAIMLFSIFSNLPQMEHMRGGPPMALFGGLGVFLVLVFLMVLVSLASLVFYIVHAANNPNLKENNLLLIWILLFIFASGIAQLIYWIIEILNKPETSR
jgi:hypothetical protein